MVTGDWLATCAWVAGLGASKGVTGFGGAMPHELAALPEGWDKWKSLADGAASAPVFPR